MCELSAILLGPQAASFHITLSPGRDLAMCPKITTEVRHGVSRLSRTHQVQVLWNVAVSSSLSSSGFFPKLD